MIKHSWARLKQQLRKNNVGLNSTKRQFEQRSVSLFGHTITAGGIQPSHDKLEATTWGTFKSTVLLKGHLFLLSFFVRGKSLSFLILILSAAHFFFPPLTFFSANHSFRPLPFFFRRSLFLRLFTIFTVTHLFLLLTFQCICCLLLFLSILVVSWKRSIVAKHRQHGKSLVLSNELINVELPPWKI